MGGASHDFGASMGLQTKEEAVFEYQNYDISIISSTNEQLYAWCAIKASESELKDKLGYVLLTFFR